MAKESYKIVILGDSGVGKSSFVEKFNTGDFKREYSPSTDINVTRVYFKRVHLDFWNVIRSGDDEKYISDADAYVIMFDLTNRHSHIHSFNDATYAVDTGKPFIICGNKSDMVDKPGTMSLQDIHIGKEFKNYAELFIISVQSGYQYAEAVTALMKKLGIDCN